MHDRKQLCIQQTIKVASKQVALGGEPPLATTSAAGATMAAAAIQFKFFHKQKSTI